MAITIKPLSPDDLDWIARHKSDDTSRLRLKYHGNEDITYLIDQLEARRKGSHKVAREIERAPGFVFPTLLSAEQCTSDLLAEYHATLVTAGERVLDMTAGLGIDAIHLSNVASTVTAVDIDPRCTDALNINAALLGIDNLTAVNADSLELLSNDSTVYDTIFVDPARRGDGGKRLYRLGDCLPDVVGNICLIMSRCKQLIIKASPMLDPTAAAAELEQYNPDVIAVGTTDECKELVMRLPGNGRRGATTIPGSEIFFDNAERDEPKFGDPAVGDILYEPFPASVKIGSFNTLSARYGTVKIGRNTHLYFSAQLNPSFPGKAHRVIEVSEFGKKAMADVVKRYGNLSVTTRDFPMTAAEIKKRFKTGESNTHRLWAVKNSKNKLVIIVTSSV
ncbi:MAG: RsmD family RNA methyltransferase [Muribaculaceae bacterium]|nr:RsmD family RNA methyltransferase [Muribaculaceae bacterium]